jgi:aldehyde oxidoreductase
MIRLTINGKAVEYTGDPTRSLLKYLREDEHLTSVKDGCSSQGTCGACLCEVDGKPVLSFKKEMGKLEGASVTTLEGFPDEVRSILGQAYVAAGAVQCGFCTPGMLARTRIILENNPNPTREEVTKQIRPNICRCTGYVKIVDAILDASEKLRNQGVVEFEKGCIGASPPKFQALERAVGEPMFMDDLQFENMAHGVLHFSEHPRARILKLDVSKAEQAEGVIRVFTAQDIPGTLKVGLMYKDWSVYIPEGEITNYIGDALACVVAETPDQARAASELIQVDYEILEAVTDPFEAMKDEIKVHEGGNLLKTAVIKRGEPIEQVFSESDYLVEDTFQTQLIEHAFMEPEASIGRYENDKLTVYSQGQGIFEDREQIAAMLGLDHQAVNVKLVAAGGAFGGKEDMTVQGHAALAAFHLKRPVKVKLSRPESMRMHPKRHPITMHYKLGCNKDGKFTGLYCDIVGDTGAYASVGTAVLERAATHAGGAYYIPNLDVTSKTVYTNNLPAGAMRGFGVNQVTFAIEGLIDELCEKAGFDRWELRYKNALEQGLLTTTGHRVRKHVGLKETLEAVKEEFQSSKYAGISCGIKNCGFGNGIPELSRVILEVKPGSQIDLYHGWSEMGQGVDTVAQQMLCDYLKLKDPFSINVIVMTEREATAGNTTASRGTFLVGKAILEAAKDLKKDLETKSLKELEGKVYDGTYLCDWTTPYNDFEGTIISHFAYSFATQIVMLDDEGKVKKVTAAHDSGIVVNRKLFEGQIEGGVVMGLGYALSEELVMENGYIKDNKFGKLGLYRSTDVPEIEVIPIEIYDEDAPFGAKGVGEICCIPTAPAVAGAFKAFDGKNRTKLPLEPIGK